MKDIKNLQTNPNQSIIIKKKNKNQEQRAMVTYYNIVRHYHKTKDN